jgi:SPP1 family predicted phage head-tail adaptor
MTRYRVNPGELRHIISFQKLVDSQNEFGEVVNEWVEVAKTRAGVYPISGKEFFSAEKVTSEVSHKLHIRFLPNISPDLRIQFNDRYFHIISVINFQEKNIELQLLCKELI